MATLATGLRARFGRAGLAPAGFHQGVFTVSSSVPPLPRFSQRDNNVGPVKCFLSALLRSLRRVVFVVFFGLLRIDDHGSFVIFRSASVRPRHLFDQNFDHDYFFKLPFQGAGCPITDAVFYFPPCPIPSCPAYEPNSSDCE